MKANVVGTLANLGAGAVTLFAHEHNFLRDVPVAERNIALGRAAGHLTTVGFSTAAISKVNGGSAGPGLALALGATGAEQLIKHLPRHAPVEGRGSLVRRGIDVLRGQPDATVFRIRAGELAPYGGLAAAASAPAGSRAQAGVLGTLLTTVGSAGRFGHSAEHLPGQRGGSWKDYAKAVTQ